MKTIELPAARALEWDMQITLKPEVRDWLYETCGFGDPKFWTDDDGLEHHIQNCLGTNRCGDPKYRCQGEVWGWTPVFSMPKMARFCFRHDDHAMLFKLAWGGQ